MSVHEKRRCAAVLKQQQKVHEELFEQKVGFKYFQEMEKQVSLHWFRKNLRLHDNPALCEAIRGSHDFFGVYVLPPLIPDANISANRWYFLLECLKDLDSSLRRLGSQLLVVQGYAGRVIPQLLKNLNVTKLTFEKETEPFGQQRDSVIIHLAENAGVEVVTCASHTLFDTDKVIEENEGQAPMLFDDFISIVSSLGPPDAPVETVDEGMFSTLLEQSSGFHDFHIPSVEELGIDRSKVTCGETWQGGEAEALRKLDDFLQEMVDDDFEVKSISDEFLHSSDGKLSPFLRFGCLSSRTFYHALAKRYVKVKGESPPLLLFEPLLQRNFYLTLGSKHPTLNKMENNPLCLQVQWEKNASAVEQWKMGKTGFPFIDAIMRQLHQEGWISDIARQVVGCFLTRGCLWNSWEEGFKLFGELQLDAEWSPNAVSWMKLSGSAFLQEEVPFFCPVEAGKKIDPTGEYIRKYVPEVKDLPTKYLFEPWRAPESVQQRAGCVVGKDYPLPLVDHKEQRRVCIQKLKKLAHSIAVNSPLEQRGHTSLHWFRKDLRLHDNPTLHACLQGSGTFYPVYVLDTAAAKHSKISANRWNFLLESLRDLDSQLRKLGSRLFVVRGRDVEVLPKLLSKWGISRLSFESDSEPHGAQRDAVVRHIAEEAGIEVLSKTSHTLYEPGQIVHANQGIVPMLFADFVTVVEDKMVRSPSPVKDVDKRLFGSCITPVAFDHQAQFGVPELSEVGVKDNQCVTSAELWKGGEKEALRRLGLLEQELVKNDFGELNAGMMPSSPTHLSPYLRFGCLSPRMMLQRLTDTYGKAKGEMPPPSFFEPLLLRDFFFMMASVNPGLHKMEKNPLCVQYPWEDNAEGLQRWKSGTTGFPWIDAVMRQLRVEGWIPHVARQAVGCFLTRGCLWINWEEGYKVFDELQLDAEWSLNAGNWLWLSGSTFVKEHVPWYCPVEVGKQIDPTGEYVRKYVPEVKDLPTKYLFEPWRAPESVQQRAGCVVGKDYPLPLVDHKEQRRVCVQRLKELAQSIEVSSPLEQRGHTTLHWFRKDLRLHDNPTLRACLQGSGTFYPVYVLDTAAAKHSKISPNRWNFLLESLRDLDSQLRKLGSRLFVVRGRDVEVLPKLLSKWGISRLSFESDSEPHGAQRDAVVRHIAEEAGIEVLSKTSHTLYEPGQIVHANQGIVPMLFADFVTVVEDKMVRSPSPVKDVDKRLFGSCITPVAFDHQAQFGVPELSEMGVKNGQCVTSAELWKGGEKEALRRLGLLEQELLKNDFGEYNAEMMASSPTHLSPYLRFGCLSPRMMLQRLTDTYGKAKGEMPPPSFYEPLLLRDFFFMVASVNPGLHKMDKNPLCVQYPWEDNAEGLQRWKNGTTGFPWIDAVMRQLRVEGWIPHVARQAVGCFLTRGCLWINWEEGYKVFDELQLDAEWSLNAGNWLWLSGSTFVKEHVPWYCPVEVGKQIDPTGDYVRKYVPEVKDLPTKYLFEPWRAPESVQQRAGCVVGKDYPLPLVDHKEQRRVCVQRLKELAQSIEVSSPLEQRGHTSLHWFRKDLRLHDNPTLRACLQGSGTFYPVYVLDTAAAKHSKISANRWNFLLESLRDLDSQLRKLGSRLFVVRGRDVEVLPKLLSKWGISRLSFESDSEPHGAQRDAVVRDIAEKAGIEVLSKTSHTLYEPGQIVHANKGIVPMLFADFVTVVEDKMVRSPSPVKDVDKRLFGSCITPVAFDHQAQFGVPELSEMGVKNGQCVTSAELWKGGEKEALRRLGLLEQELLKNDFGEYNAEMMPSSPTHLSPYLRFGCLSPRMMLQRLTDTYGKAKGEMPPPSFYEPLLLRDFFFMVASVNPGLHKMDKNPLCVQYPWEDNTEGLQRWKNGTTGFPWIDAVMRQLRVEGWIPHVARQAVGCFLTRGCLWINWEEGYKVFDELQLDAEWSLNAGNWLWLSGSTFVKEHVPWYCPVEVGKQIDPTGEYVRKYVPEVKDLPTKYLFEPWRAPESVQQRAGCVVGKDYPLPLVDHKEQRRVCVQRLKELAQSIEVSSPLEQRGHTSLHWFRKDLRLHDNPTLRACLQGSGTFYPVYMLDTAAAKHSKISPNRWNFLLESLRDLDSQLRKLGSRLFVVRGRDVEVLPKLLSKWGISRLSFESDSEPHGAQRDAVVRHIAEKAGIEVLSKTSHTLYEPGQIVHANQGIVPMLFADFVTVVEDKMVRSPSPVKDVDKRLFGSCITPVAFDHQAQFGVPELSEVGVKDGQCVTSAELWKGGEKEALRRLGVLEQELLKNDFGEYNAEMMPSSPTHLSPYLRFGCLSPRMMLQRLTDTYGKAKGEMPPPSFYEPLLLRDFFFMVASVNPGLHKMDKNPLCVQYPWEDNAEGLQRWKNGTTGFPWIDAVMRQLRVEGWIPHVARQAVGCFLTRGCLWINWEEGYKVFDELQLDAEWSLNAGNWLWLSGSTFVKEHVPWYCPVEVGKQIDPTGEYVRKYVPEVKDLPTKYLFEPWRAPESVQQRAGCVVGKDYPLPLVDHKEQRRVCVQRLKELAQSIEVSSPLEQRRHTSLHWFRKDLRLHDNPTLRACLQGSGTFYPVYVLDTAAAKHSKISANRWNFLLESLRDLDSQLRKLGSRLFVVRGRDVEVLPKLLSKWGISRLSFESDSEPHGAQRDAVVRHIAEEAGIEVLSKTSHTLYEPGQIVHANQGIVPMLFADFVTVVEDKMVRSPSPVKDVDKRLFGSCITPVAFDHQAQFGVPELSEVGVKDGQCVTSAELWKGGEKEALRRLGLLEQELLKNDFGEYNAEMMPSSPTHLSPYLRFGCLSPRMMLQRLTDTYGKAKGEMPPPSFYEPLLLREFFFMVASVNPGLHKMDKNPMCVQYPWEDNAEGLQRWKSGTTGFPWIDAVMRQLRVEGWIPHVARQAVGCFLTRGCLWINWEEGYKVFDELQLDAEWSLNAGNWLWLSGSTFVKEHVPWYCPVEVGKIMDPTGEYVRKYVPEVKHLPAEYVHQPWKAPFEVQEAAHCVVGDDYPERVVDHLEQRKICVQRLKDLCISMDIAGHNSIHWFRKDLRLHDNPTLRACLADSKSFYGVYFLEPCPERRKSVSANRWQFLLQSLQDLDTSLARCGSRLFVVEGRPVDMLPSLFNKWDITRLSFETDSEPYGKARDSVVTSIAKQAGVEVISHVSHTLYDVDEMLSSVGGTAPQLFDEFEELVEERGRPQMPAPRVTKKLFGSCVTPVGRDHSERYGVPSLEEFGMGKANGLCSVLYSGGEQEALVRMKAAVHEIIKNDFSQPLISAESLMPSASHLSPYLRLGCLSPRLLYQKITEEYIKTKASNPPVTIYQQLLFREFFFTVASQTAGLHEMVNNPLCLQFPWEDNPEYLESWKQGLTGFPWIDAIMRQLASEGWIHNVARIAVGSFLTRGCLWVNWQEGFKVFDELQLDAEWSLNAGNWLWLSGSTFVKEHVPWYCPVEVGKHIDPTGEYIRKYVPEVRHLPPEYMFEPWLAPNDVQKSSGCVIGQDYPAPIVDHREQRTVCVQRLKDLAIKLTSGH